MGNDQIIQKVLRTWSNRSVGLAAGIHFAGWPDGQMAKSVYISQSSGGPEGGGTWTPPENDLVTLRPYETSARLRLEFRGSGRPGIYVRWSRAVRGGAPPRRCAAARRCGGGAGAGDDGHGTDQ